MRPPSSTRPDPLFTHTPCFRAHEALVADLLAGARDRDGNALVLALDVAQRARLALHDGRVRPADHPRGAAARSEEHTSELQSLMRTAYAVFCLTKQTPTGKTTTTEPISTHPKTTNSPSSE